MHRHPRVARFVAALVRATHFCNSQRLMACAAATLIKFQRTRLHSLPPARSLSLSVRKSIQFCKNRCDRNFTKLRAATLAKNEAEKNISFCSLRRDSFRNQPHFKVEQRKLRTRLVNNRNQVSKGAHPLFVWLLSSIKLMALVGRGG